MSRSSAERFFHASDTILATFVVLHGNRSSERTQTKKIAGQSKTGTHLLFVAPITHDGPDLLMLFSREEDKSRFETPDIVTELESNFPYTTHHGVLCLNTAK